MNKRNAKVEKRRVLLLLLLGVIILVTHRRCAIAVVGSIPNLHQQQQPMTAITKETAPAVTLVLATPTPTPRINLSKTGRVNLLLIFIPHFRLLLLSFRRPPSATSLRRTRTRRKVQCIHLDQVESSSLLHPKSKRIRSCSRSLTFNLMTMTSSLTTNLLQTLF